MADDDNNDDDDYLMASSLEPTPIRMKRFSLGHASPDDLNGSLLINQQEATKGEGKKLTNNSALPTTTTTTRRTTAAYQNNAHDHHHHHSMHHDHTRIQVSDGIFDLDKDSHDDDSRLSNLVPFQDFKPARGRQSFSKDKNKKGTPLLGTLGKNREASDSIQRKKIPSLPPPPGVTKDSLGGLTKTKKKQRKENTKQEEYQSQLSSSKNIIKNRKTNTEVQKLADALEKSAQSQQEIHQWDRKMGLKRSHSKTMTQSMQTRKKLRDILYNMSEAIHLTKEDPSSSL